MLRNSRFIVFLIIASMTYLTGCKDSGIPVIQATDPASITAAVLKENDQPKPISITQESVEAKKNNSR